MPPILALVATLFLIGYLVRAEIRSSGRSDAAIWLTSLWVFLLATRTPAQWFNLIGIPIPGGQSTGGNLVDATTYLGLILAAASTLHRRQLRLRKFTSENPAMTIILAVTGTAILWSPEPIASFKQYIKFIGHPIFALLLITDRSPLTAIRSVLTKASIPALALSVLFIKYYPEWGRGFDPWSGLGMNTGATMNKNLLGADCLIFGAFLIWKLSYEWRNRATHRPDLYITIPLLLMTSWLLFRANSATSLATFCIAAIIVVLLTHPRIRPDRADNLIIICLIVALAAQYLFNASAVIAVMLGRDPTLTGRTENWEYFLSLADSPILGAGFEGFWKGARLDIITERFWWKPNQAHNGYIETYLNLGIIGLLVYAFFIVSAYSKIRQEIRNNKPLAPLFYAIMVVSLFYNYTEAPLFRLHIAAFAFYLSGIRYTKRSQSISSKALGHTDYPQPSAS